MRSVAIAVVFAMIPACGRIGFDRLGRDGGDDGGNPGNLDSVAPDQIGVHVESNATTMHPNGGEPVAGAYVQIDRTSGPELVRTDALGNATFDAPTPTTTVDIAFPSDDGSWYVLTAIDLPPGMILPVGKELILPVHNTVQINMPAGPSMDYEVDLPLHCSLGGGSTATSPTVFLQYDPGCEGQSVHAYGYNQANMIGPGKVLDLGMIELTSGAGITPGNAYTTEAAVNVNVDNIPTGNVAIGGSYATTIAGTPGDLMLRTTLTGSTQTGTTTTVNLYGPGDTFIFSIESTVANLEIGVFPYTGATIDATPMLPPFLIVTSDASGVTTNISSLKGTDLERLDVTYPTPVPLLWTVLAPPGVTTFTFPTLPSAIAANAPTAAPTMTNGELVDAGTLTYSDLLVMPQRRIAVGQSLQLDLYPGTFISYVSQ